MGHVPPRRGRDDIAALWDTGISVLEDVRFEIRRAHEAPGEALMLVDLAVRAPGGVTARYDAALHHRFDGDGRIVALRAFWDLPAVMAQFAAGGR